MKIRLLLVLLCVSGFLRAQEAITIKLVPETCLTDVEQQLAAMINTCRGEKGLPPVELSASLSYVARIHAMDLEENYRQSDRCNLHSWSDKGNWTPCCYTADHKKSACMWDKPRELTSYPGDGFEISYFTTQKYASPADFARDILKGWKGSPGHNSVIMNLGTWKDVNWKAMGVGVSGGYATVWFGQETDPAGKPSACE